MQLLPDRYVTVGEVRTRYWAMGDDGPALVLIHGLGGSVENWLLNIGPLARQHRVFAVDLIGFGRTDKPRISYSISRFVDFILQFMASQGLERATLVGNSLGGGVALAFALRYPSQVESLVLVGGAGFGRQMARSLRLATFPLLGEILARPRPSSARRQLQEVFYDPTIIGDEWIDLMVDLASLPGAKRALLSTLRTMAGPRGPKARLYQETFSALSSMAAPTLVIWGRQDRILPVEHAFIAERILPNARLHVFDQCGHVPQIERSQEFNTLVLEFLQGQA